MLSFRSDRSNVLYKLNTTKKHQIHNKHTHNQLKTSYYGKG